MSRHAWLLLILCTFAGEQMLAQQLQPAQGKVTVIQEDKIDQLAVKYRQLSRQNPFTDGYRIQLFSESGTNSKNRAMAAKDNFQAAYPGVKAYLSYKAPNYRVRAGNFHTLIEAAGFLKEIGENYPNAFAVKDKINY